MANELLKQNYQDIADAIRSKTGSESTITPNSMPQAIENMTTMEDMSVFGPDTTKYYQSSYGYSLYYPSGQTLDMEECSGELFEHTASISSSNYYQVESSAIIGYDGSNPLEVASGAFYAHSMEITSSFYQAASSGYLGYDGDNPLESVNSFEVYEGNYYQASQYAQFAGDDTVLTSLSSKTLNTGRLYMGLGKEFGYDASLGYPVDDLTVDILNMNVGDTITFEVGNGDIVESTREFTITRTV